MGSVVAFLIVTLTTGMAGVGTSAVPFELSVGLLSMPAVGAEAVETDTAARTLSISVLPTAGDRAASGEAEVL